jgi:hypothetical protein
MNTPTDNSNNQQTSVTVEQYGTDDKTNTDQEKKQQLQKIHEARLTRIKNESVNMVCRQTDYDENTARAKLETVDYNYEIVLNEFYGITNKKTDPSINNNMTTNQQIYGEIRNLMDVGSRKFRTDQENAEQYKKMISKVD